MKATILISAVLFSIQVFSQKTDSALVMAVEKRVALFKPVIREYLHKAENSSDMDSIRSAGKSLEEGSKALIVEIKAAFKINDDYIAAYATDMALATALPEMASFYQLSAIVKLNDGLSQKKPVYLASLVKIKENARRLSKVKKMANAGKFSRKIRAGYQELIAVHTESKLQ